MSLVCQTILIICQNGWLSGVVDAAKGHTVRDTRHRTTRTWRIVLQETALETIAALHPRLGRLKDGVWVPNFSEIARQGGVSKQHLSNAVAGRDGAGEAVHSALLGVAATYGLGPDLAWGKLFKLVQGYQVADSVRDPRAHRVPPSRTAIP